MSIAAEIMTQDPITVPITSTVNDAVQVLQNAEIRHLPVVNAQGELVGMLSDRDLRALSIPRTLNDRWLGEFRIALETRIADVMSADVIAVQEEAEVGELIDLMLEHKIGAVPVLNADGALVGIVSYIDVLRACSELEASADD